MSSTATSPCPKCGAPSELEPAETVDVGVGAIPIEPDAWICKVHGYWWVPDWDKPPLFADNNQGD